MPPKRKRSTSALDEVRVVKRQLRPRHEVDTSPSKPSTTTRRVQSSPRKRARVSDKKGGKQASLFTDDDDNDDDDDDDDDDEIAPNSPTRPRGRAARQATTSAPETRYLSDETNLSRLPTGRTSKETVTPCAERPKARRGRPPRSAAKRDHTVPEISVEEPAISEYRPTTRRSSTKKVEVVICTPSKPARKTRASRSISKEGVTASDPSDNDHEFDNSVAHKGIKNTPALQTPSRATRKRVLESEASESSDTEYREEPSAASSKRAKTILAPQTPAKNTRRRVVEPEPSNFSEIDQVQSTANTSISKRKTRTPASRPSPNISIEFVRSSRPESPAPSGSQLISTDISLSKATSQANTPVITPLLSTDQERRNFETEHTHIKASTPAATTALRHSQTKPIPELSGVLPVYLHPCLSAYKQAILKGLQSNYVASTPDVESTPYDVASKQLMDLIDGTVLRAEGNSCLLLGPRSSGKSQIIESCLEKVAFQKPIILRLSGWVQKSDRHALREIAFQLLQQTGSSLLPESASDPSDPVNEDGEENPFLDNVQGGPTITLPPSSHLHALIPVLLTLSRPVIVVLDAFDLFALHPRQSLLYCLLDTVQNCRASSDSRGLAVIGVTNRVDTVQLLEKRVKSRFSGRTIRTAPPGDLKSSLALVKTILQPKDVCDDEELEEEWSHRWQLSVDNFLADKKVLNIFNETFSITKNFKVIARILITCVLRLTPSQPCLSFRVMAASVDAQRSRPRNLHLTNLSYPWLCLLIASAHADTAGHSIFTFEMLYETFRNQVRASASAPVQLNGGNIGMVRCTRDVLGSAFEEMSAARIFVCTVAPSSNVAKEFLKYRCAIPFPDIKPIVEKSGQTSLKKWLNKGN